jgi:hypothetical protein
MKGRGRWSTDEMGNQSESADRNQRVKAKGKKETATTRKDFLGTQWKMVLWTVVLVVYRERPRGEV